MMKKYLVIGNPIDHSLSPKLQNYWLKQNNINAVYDKIKIEENEIKEIIQDIREQKIAGCNVTVPFKKKVIPFLDKLSPQAEQTQSAVKLRFPPLCTKLVTLLGPRYSNSPLILLPLPVVSKRLVPLWYNSTAPFS